MKNSNNFFIGSYKNYKKRSINIGAVKCGYLYLFPSSELTRYFPKDTKFAENGGKGVVLGEMFKITASVIKY